MDVTQPDNPYAVTFDEAPPSRAELNYARNIRAIGALYVFSGLIAIICGGIVWADGAPLPGAIVAGFGLVSIMPGAGVLRNRRWAVPACQVVSVLFLIWIPFGTVLGFYFLKNIGKVRHMFR